MKAWYVEFHNGRRWMLSAAIHTDPRRRCAEWVLRLRRGMRDRGEPVIGRVRVRSPAQRGIKGDLSP